MAPGIALPARNLFAIDVDLESPGSARTHQEPKVQVVPRNDGPIGSKIENQPGTALYILHQGTNRHLPRVLLDYYLRSCLHQPSGIHLHLHGHIWVLAWREG